MLSLATEHVKYIESTRRRGHLKSINSLEARDPSKCEAVGTAMTAPKPTFNNNTKSKYTRSVSIQQEPVPPQHEELVLYLWENWQEAEREYHKSLQKGKMGSIFLYTEKQPNPQMADFKPFDVDKWHLSRTRGKSK